MWDTLVFRKCQELTGYLLGKAPSFDQKSPRPVLERSDTRELRSKILALSQSEARNLRISKSTLHELRRNAKNLRCFRLYRKTSDRLR